MWVLTSDGATLVDLYRCNRIFISEHGGDFLISAVIERTDRPVTLCKCAHAETARETLAEIAEAIENDAAVYYAPESYIDRKMSKIRDSRVKRRGGS